MQRLLRFLPRFLQVWSRRWIIRIAKWGYKSRQVAGVTVLGADLGNDWDIISEHLQRAIDLVERNDSRHLDVLRRNVSYIMLIEPRQRVYWRENRVVEFPEQTIRERDPLTVAVMLVGDAADNDLWNQARERGLQATVADLRAHATREQIDFARRFEPSDYPGIETLWSWLESELATSAGEHAVDGLLPREQD